VWNVWQRDWCWCRCFVCYLFLWLFYGVLFRCCCNIWFTDALWLVYDCLYFVLATRYHSRTGTTYSRSSRSCVGTYVGVIRRESYQLVRPYLSAPNHALPPVLECNVYFSRLKPATPIVLHSVLQNWCWEVSNVQNNSLSDDQRRDGVYPVHTHSINTMYTTANYIGRRRRR